MPADLPNCAKYAPPSTAAVRAQFDAFWAEFRSAVERGDKEAIANFTRLPLSVCGTFDEDAKKKLNRKAFLKAIDGMLDEQDALEEKHRELADTPRKYIVALRQGPQGCDYNDEQASVANLRFRPKAGKWALVTVYSDVFNK